MMSRYQMDGGTIVDTDRATNSWVEEEDWDGNNNVSRNTGSQWHWERLYRSRRGRYYVVHISGEDGVRDYAEWLSPEGAARWLDLNGWSMPDELAAAAEAVTE